jgi:hypothetical protein
MKLSDSGRKACKQKKGGNLSGLEAIEGSSGGRGSRRGHDQAGEEAAENGNGQLSKGPDAATKNDCGWAISLSTPTKCHSSAQEPRDSP